MKRKIEVFTLSIIVLTIISTFTSCFSLDDITSLFINEKDLTFCFDYTKLSQNVEKAEIVYVEDYSCGESGKITVVTELDYQTTLMLIEDFSKIQYITPIFGDPPELNGHCIRLCYKDGHYEIYDDYGTSVKFAWCLDDINREQFDKLIEKYK